MKAIKFKKRTILSKNHISAVRYGGINKLVKQKGNYTVAESNSMHKAPERRGFYCFIRGYEEHFLLGGVANGGKGRFNKEGKIESQRKVFNIVGGYIWTHLEPPKTNMIAGIKDSWYKVKVDDFQKIFNSDKSQLSIDTGKFSTYDGILKNPYVWYSRDDLEIFIGKDAIIE